MKFVIIVPVLNDLQLSVVWAQLITQDKQPSILIAERLGAL